MSLSKNDPQLASMGWSGYQCAACNSVILVGVVPIGWGSIAPPICSATDQTGFMCEGRLQQISTANVSLLFNMLCQDVSGHNIASLAEVPDE